MAGVTYLGEPVTLIALAVLLIIFKKTRKLGINIAIALIIGLLVANYGIKLIAKRPRPFTFNNFNLIISKPGGEYSFPSGHAVAVFEVATVVFKRYKKLGVWFIVLASLIAFSRLYLYVHFPTDVVAGAVLGIGVGLLSVFITDKIYNKTKLKK